MTTKKFDFFVTIFAAMIIVVFGPMSIYRWVDGHSTNDDQIGSISSSSSEHDNVFGSVNEETAKTRRKNTVENLKRVFRNRGDIENVSTRHERTVPYFIIESFNSISTPGGVARRDFPYDANVMRSCKEISHNKTQISHIYQFNISKLETNEFVLKAELHLHLSETSLQANPSLNITVYQVLKGKNLTKPDLHQLLSSHQVVNDIDGWQIFDVTPAALAWTLGTPNLGLIITTKNLTNHYVDVEFSHEISPSNNSKQPILILFNSDDGGSSNFERNPIRPTNLPEKAKKNGQDENSESSSRKKRDTTDDDEDEGTTNETKVLTSADIYREAAKRQKKTMKNSQKSPVEEQDLNHNHRPSIRTVDQMSNFESNTYDDQHRGGKAKKNAQNENSESSLRKKRERTNDDAYEGITNETEFLTSADIYREALKRQKETMKNSQKSPVEKQNLDHNHGRSMRAVDKMSNVTVNNTITIPIDNTFVYHNYNRCMKEAEDSINDDNYNRCTKHELILDYAELGFDDKVIAPERSEINQCLGKCGTLVEQDPPLSTHAYLREIFLEGKRAYCVPKRLSNGIIVYVDIDSNIVFGRFDDMIVESCECR